jgi:hypothetical protein
LILRPRVMVSIIALVWPVVGCVGVLAVRRAKGHAIDLTHVILGLTGC